MIKNSVSLLILLAFLLPVAAMAQTPKIAEQPCDANYWRQMTFRAWQEAEREIMQNQNLIFKPDSVLQYTCFNEFNNIAAAQGGEIFTHTTYFGEQIITRSQNESTNKGMNLVVHDPLVAYVRNNFSGKDGVGTLLGGRGATMSIRNDRSSVENGPKGENSVSYSCKHMAEVWQSAKCANFIDNNNYDGEGGKKEAADGFYPFDTIKGFEGEPDAKGYKDLEDVRIYPTACNNFNAWEPLKQLADNEFETLYKFQSPLGEIYKEVNDKILPVKSGAAAGESYAPSCGDAVMTGVKVITKDGEQGEDGVCTNPGCTFSKRGGTQSSGGSGGTCLE